VATLVALAHALFSVFVVGGLVLLAAGLVFGWRWARHPGFRIAHCGAVLFIAARAWLGLSCPLTQLEDHLRVNAAGERHALVRYAHAAAFRGEDPDRFRSAVTLWALASVGLAVVPLSRKAGGDRTPP
jgi:polyferredoxin